MDYNTKLKINPAQQFATNFPRSELDGFQEMLVLLGKKTDPIPPEYLAQHITVVTAEMDWPVRRAATYEILKRFTACSRDQLKVIAGPKGREAKKLGYCGLYRTGKSKKEIRPYQVRIYSIQPLHMSCDCPDFRHSSLGLCKHGIAILKTIGSELSNFKSQDLPMPETDRTLLCWDPIAPATGNHDPLLRVFWPILPSALPSSGKSRIGKDTWNLEKLFRKGTNGKYQLLPSLLKNQDQRLSAVRALLSHLQRSAATHPVDPALLTVLQREQERLLLISRGKIENSAISRQLKTLKRPLFSYQEETVRRFITQTRLLLADDMGLGKTAQAIACAHVLYGVGKVKRGLVIVPASLKGQWEREWQSFTAAPIELVDGAVSERKNVYERTLRGFLVVNYEQVLKDLALIVNWNPDLVILDEAQRIKNWESKTSAYVKSLTPNYRLVLSGTPFENRLDELATVLDWVDPLALQPRWRLVPWHNQYADGKSLISGARNLDTLRERISPAVIRRRRKEVLSQLPARQDTSLAVSMTESQLEAHDSLRKYILALLNILKKRPLTQAEFLRLMSLLNMQRIFCNGLEQAHFETCWEELSQVKQPSEEFLARLDSPKLLEFYRLVEQLAVHQDRKIVVFSQWRRMLLLAQWAIRGLLSKANMESRFFTGHESQQRRRQNVIDFHDEDHIRLMFLSDAGGVGLNLQRAANCCINLDLPWNPAVLEQRIGRIYRLGQEDPIDVFNLVAVGGIEGRISDVVSNKKALFEGVFDGTSDEVLYGEAKGFLGTIEKMMKPTLVPVQPRKGRDSNLPDTDLEIQRAAEESEEQVPELVEQASLVKAADLDASDFDPSNEDLEVPVIEDSLPSQIERQVEASPPFVDAPGPEAVRQLFSNLRVERNSSGGLSLHASPESASTLAALFEGFASILRASS